MSAKYLAQSIAETKVEPCRNPFSGMTRQGYTCRRGAPTRFKIRLFNETRWRRLYCWQFSNAGTCFVRIGGECLIVNDIPEVK